MMLPLAAAAQSKLGPNGSPITTSNYSVDLTMGVARGNARIRAMGGAYVAVAEGVGANLVNPAGSAIRGPWSRMNFNYDFGLFMTFPGGAGSKDWFNSGTDGTDIGADRPFPFAFTFLTFTNNFRLGKWGLGFTLEYQNYGIGQDDRAPTGLRSEYVSRYTTGHLQLARNLGDLTIGAGLRWSSLRVTEGFQGLSHTATGAAEIGFLWHPERLPLRVGASFYSASQGVNTADADGLATLAPGGTIAPLPADGAGNFYLPAQMTMPFVFSYGVSYQFGQRPYNLVPRNVHTELRPLRRRMRRREIQRQAILTAAENRARREGEDPERATRELRQAQAAERGREAEGYERERRRRQDEITTDWVRLPRRYLLLSSQFTVTGPVSNAVGVESFVQQIVNRSGERATISLHFGAETELIPNWLKVRAGTYLEPSRFSTPESSARIHGTGGLELKLLAWRVFRIFPAGTIWRVGSFFDAAPRYFAWGAGIGNWH